VSVKTQVRLICRSWLRDEQKDSLDGASCADWLVDDLNMQAGVSPRAFLENSL
jgi:hypothetical protein